jgi:hypothetical protein
LFICSSGLVYFLEISAFKYEIADQVAKIEEKEDIRNTLNGIFLLHIKIKKQISTRNFLINCHLYKKDAIYGQRKNRR